MKKEMFKKSNIVKVAVMIGVIIIPLMYSFFYLSAFWDPYSKLDKLPVAIVNDDKGATINANERNLGKEISEKLINSDEMDFIVTDYDDAKEGTEKDGYYAMIVFPEDFTSSISSASEKEKQSAKIVFSPNDKKNYLAGQILSRAVLQLEESTREAVTKELVDSLTENINGLPNQMSELQSGLNKLSDGSNSLVDGGTKLSNGATEFESKFNLYAQGVFSLKSGVTNIKDGSAKLSAGAKSLNDGLIPYSAGVDTLIKSANETSTFISSYVKAHPELMNDPTFAAFIQKMSDPKNAQSIQALSAAGAQLKAGSSDLAKGSADLASGSSSLSQGVEKISSATTELSGASTKIKNGATELNNGLSQLNDGLIQAKGSVDKSIESATQQLSGLDGLGDFASKSVIVDTQTINPISNYGTYFTPYFLSLSLWVGALMIFFGIYLDADGKFAILSRKSDKKIIRNFIYLALGFAQAILLGTVLKTALGLDVENVAFFFLSICLVSLVFITIVQFCIVHLGDSGKFVAILLLILQLTSCGGTFPMETVPKFFNVLYPFMPMTYSVDLFKDAIIGNLDSSSWANVGILTIIFVVFLSATILLSLYKKKKTAKAIV